MYKINLKLILFVMVIAKLNADGTELEPGIQPAKKVNSEKENVMAKLEADGTEQEPRIQRGINTDKKKDDILSNELVIYNKKLNIFWKNELRTKRSTGSRGHFDPEEEFNSWCVVYNDSNSFYNCSETIPLDYPWNHPCCRGECINGHCDTKCAVENETCFTHDDCCYGACKKNTCQLKPFGSVCKHSIECMGQACHKGYCLCTLPGATPVYYGGSNTFPWEKCCRGKYTLIGHYCEMKCSFDICKIDEDCCYGNCINHTCQGKPGGSKCSLDIECFSLTCRLGVCATCSTLYCYKDEQCCSKSKCNPPEYRGDLGLCSCKVYAGMTNVCKNSSPCCRGECTERLNDPTRKICTPLPECIDTNERCDINEDCCVGYCVNHTCQCYQSGYCRGDFDCCSGVCFETSAGCCNEPVGTCACGHSGSKCGSDSSCCNRKCVNHTCEGRLIGDQCTMNYHCDTNYCNNGTCQCQPRGYHQPPSEPFVSFRVCSKNSDCCDGVCGQHNSGRVHCNCQKNDGPCTNSKICCSSYCPNKTCKCKTQGLECIQDPECCDGYKCINDKCNQCKIHKEPCVKSAHCCKNHVCLDGICLRSANLLEKCTDTFTCQVANKESECYNGTCLMKYNGVCLNNKYCISGDCQINKPCILQDCLIPKCQCKSNGVTCLHSGQCCSQKYTTTCMNGKCCRDISIKCSTSEECCSDKCVKGTCVLKLYGEQCSNGNECISNVCENKKCGCKLLNINCAVDMECCEETKCLKNKCSNCYEGVGCKINPTCCMGYNCINGTCNQCKKITETCTTDNECCGTNGRCFIGKCGNCKPVKAQCKLHHDCCSTVCLNGLCNNCKLEDGPCKISSDCCSGVCSKGKCTCQENGAQCNVKSNNAYECCKNHWCKRGICTLVSLGEVCILDNECFYKICRRPANRPNSRTGRCEPPPLTEIGEPCFHDVECGDLGPHDYICNNGLCQCSEKGERCEGNFRCCTGQCKATTCQ